MSAGESWKIGPARYVMVVVADSVWGEAYFKPSLTLTLASRDPHHRTPLIKVDISEESSHLKQFQVHCIRIFNETIAEWPEIEIPPLSCSQAKLQRLSLPFSQGLPILKSQNLGSARCLGEKGHTCARCRLRRRREDGRIPTVSVSSVT